MKKTKKVEGIEIDQVNKNGRIYYSDLLKSKIQDYQKLIDDKLAIGELGHPENSSIISLKNASHRITKVFVSKQRFPRKMKKSLKKKGLWKGEKRELSVEVEPLETGSGKVFSELMKKNINFDIGMRAIGSVSEDGIIQDDLEIISFDIIK